MTTIPDALVHAAIGLPADPLAPLTALPSDSPLPTIGEALRAFSAAINGVDPLGRRLFREQAIHLLKQRDVSGAAGLVDAALERPEAEVAASSLVADVVPAADPQDGNQLLTDISTFITSYLYLPVPAAETIACWVVLTHLSETVLHAPILAVLSATRRCGKTVLLDLLRPLVRRGYLTSATGITSPVLFRLNERDHPVLLIDEGEKLAGRHVDRDLVGMLNVGYRRGARALRCVERNGVIDIEDFDAFGFRCIAAIGSLWDTLMDRSIVIRLERIPRGQQVRRFRDVEVTAAGQALARRIVRWTQDHRDAITDACHAAPRPDWLDPRACDNWAGPLAIAMVAGGDWVSRLQAAARSLRGNPDDEQDHGERLIHDLQAVFKEAGNPEVIKSGDVITQLVAIEVAPWGDYRHGQPLTTHGLAKLLRRFGVRPRRDWTATGESIRGWWRADLEPVFSRYGTVVTDVTAGAGTVGGEEGMEERLEREAIQQEGIP